MPEAVIYNNKGEKIGTLKLSKRVFGEKESPALIHEAVVAMRANARRSTAHTKTRGEVRGGGKKPWRQKGTGRARHGSIRSPIWRGGGVTFGPRNDRNYSKKMNDRARINALLMALSNKAVNGNILIVDDFKFTKSKTKEMSNFLKNLKIKFPALIVYQEGAVDVKKISKNMEKVFTNSSNNLHLIDVLKARSIVVAKQAIEEIEAKYDKNKR